ncbi:hypothetical protein JHK86_007104 [Glycine max]|nr:hypothetical protein JHK86_007104 [Glycine max]
MAFYSLSSHSKVDKPIWSLILVFYWDYTVANGDRYKNGEGNHHVYLFGFREAYLFVQRSGTTLGPRHIVSKWANLAHQRKIIAPELYLDKVKEMVNLIVDATNITQRSWEARPESEGAVSEIKMDKRSAKFVC